MHYHEASYSFHDLPENATQLETPIEDIGHRTQDMKVKSTVITQTNSITSEYIDVERWLHKYIIGEKEANIKQLTQNLSKVQVDFFDDQIVLEGPSEEVKKAKEILMNMITNLKKQLAYEEVKVNPLFHRHIIGKNGGNVNKLKQYSRTLISIPSWGNGDIIRIEGGVEDVGQVKKALMEMLDKMEDEVTVDFLIEQDFHCNLIGAKGENVQNIKEKFNQVNITFPNPDLKCDKISLCGPKLAVESCYEYLQALNEEMKLASFRVDVQIHKQNHKYIIGKGGTNIKKITDETNTRIDLPSEGSKSDVISIRGKKEDVLVAKCKILAIQEELNISEDKILIDPKYHHHFVTRHGEVLKQIADEFGGVNVSFPKKGSNSHKVKLKGVKSYIEGAKARLLEIVQDLDSTITVECEIPQEYHGTVLGSKGLNVQCIQRDFDVTIKFPDRVTKYDSDGLDMFANYKSEYSRCNIIIIKGKKENCEKARLALLDIVPVTEEVEVPFDLHKFIIGKKGKSIQAMRDVYDVNIIIPNQRDHSNFITIKGPLANVEKTKQALKERVEELELEKQDRLLKSFKLIFELDPQYHPRIIGRNGKRITKIRKENDVQIKIPELDSPNKRVITITGNEKNAKAAKEAILKLVQKQEGMYKEKVTIDYRIHSLIIGSKAQTGRTVMEEFNVNISFPRTSNADPNSIVICGAEEDVLDAKDYLLNLEEEYLQDMKEKDFLPVQSTNSNDTFLKEPKDSNCGVKEVTTSDCQKFTFNQCKEVKNDNCLSEEDKKLLCLLTEAKTKDFKAICLQANRYFKKK